MIYSDIIYENKDGVARITINRPDKLNSFRSQTMVELADALKDASADVTVGVIVLTGAGGKSFCAGGDISEMKELNPQTGRAFLDKCAAVSSAIRSAPKPVIARVDGYCLGGGHEIHLFCDLTIASESSVFGQTGPTVGSIPIWGGTQLLPLMVGEKKAREVVFLCQRYSAREALEMGLVNKVVPKEKLDEEVNSACARILEMSPQSLRIAKLSFNFLSDLGGPSYTHGKELLTQVYGSDELKEGMNAFLEKRKPDFGKFRK